MTTEVGKFSFEVPDGHPEAGTKIEKTFDFDVVASDDEASKLIGDRKWKLVNIVNKALKAAARSNAYQNALTPYRPTEVSADDIRERMIRDYIRLGVKEDVARAQVESLLANQ